MNAPAITLPWPDPLLNPNSRAHWRPIAKATAAARRYAWAVCNDERPQVTPFILVRHTPPDRRLRDQGNMKDALKAYYDGIQDASGINDREFRVHHIFAEPQKPGKVEFSFHASERDVIAILADNQRETQ